MGKFKKKANVSQEIPTSALPDIIFILLFFFMVTTKVRKSDPDVKVMLPGVSQVQELDASKEVIDVYIGYPKDASYGTEPVIQVGKKFIRPKEIRQVIAQTLDGMPEVERSVNKILVNVRIHEDVSMGCLLYTSPSPRDA